MPTVRDATALKNRRHLFLSFWDWSWSVLSHRVPDFPLLLLTIIKLAWLGYQPLYGLFVNEKNIWNCLGRACQDCE